MAAVATTAVVSTTLLRALSKHAARNHDELDDDVDDDADRSIGVLLGALLPPTAAATAAAAAESSTSSAAPSIAIWGLLRREADIDVVTSGLPAGITALGHFAVVQRAAGDEAIAACAQRVAAQRKSILDALVLVFVRATGTAQLFHVPTVAGAAHKIALTTVACLHAREFLASTRCVLLRCALDMSAANVKRWQRALKYDGSDADGSDALFFRVGSSAAVVRADGVDVTGSSKTTNALILAALLGTPSDATATRKPQASTSKAAKKSSKTKKSSAAQAALDAWDNEPSSADADSSNNSSAAAANALRTLEYGDIANVEVLASLSVATATSLAAAPVLTIPDASASAADAAAPSLIHLHADVLALVSLETPVRDVLELLREQLRVQLTQLGRALQDSTATRVEAHHFALTGAAFPLTLVTTSDNTAAAADAIRTRDATLCEALLQPLNDAPRFDPARCSLVRSAALLQATDVLVNVHEGVPASGVVGGEQSVVDGFYGYYHYMQQGVNDKGWGCAYRSLQTLASWLELNHFVTATGSDSDSESESVVPTHDAIQRTLVHIGDKPPSFVGSREWIGSLEVGYVLDELFGISFRSLSAPSGPQLVDLANELAHHFATQGTPVMIGGGQLAFTLLGVDYCKATGECAFLILDPHYTGRDDLDVIQTKVLALEGYKAIACGWRRASTFAKNSFYNLCLPQRPQV